jgi:hypothetical protein
MNNNNRTTGLTGVVEPDMRARRFSPDSDGAIRTGLRALTAVLELLG